MSILLTLALPFSAQAQETYPLIIKQQKPFLFEVEKDGKVSHILGSMHAGIALRSYPTLIFDLAEKSKNMVFESDAGAFYRENAEAIKAAKIYPAGESLDQHLSPKALSKLKELFGNEEFEDLMKYRPWAISQDIDSGALDSLKKETPPGLWDPYQGIDNTLLAKSKRSEKPITYLDDSSRKTQDLNEYTSAEDLEKLLSYPDPVGHLKECMRMAQGIYLSGDEHSFERYNRKCENENLLRRLQERTISWVPKLEPILKAGDAFVVVGAGHMDGPNGLHALLTGKGYKVRRLGPNGEPSSGNPPTYSNSLETQTVK